MKIIFLLTFIINILFSHQLYIDDTRELNIKDIVKLKDKFQPSSKKTFGITKDILWFKVVLKNDTKNTKTQFLQVDMPYLNSVNFYEINGKETVEYKNGALIPIDKRDVSSYNIVHKTKLDANSIKTIYIKVKSKTLTQILISVYQNENDYKEQSRYITIMNTAILSIAIFMFIYNLLIYSYIKDKIYLYYLGYLSSFIYLYLVLNMTPFFSIFGESIAYIIPLGASLITISTLLFIKNILNLQKYNYKLAIFFNIFIMIIVFETLYFFVDLQMIIPIRNLTILISYLGLFIVLIYAIYIKIPYAKLVFFGWFIFLIGVLITISITLGFIEFNYIAFHILFVSVIFETIVFSLILASKINVFKDEKYILSQQINNQNKLLQKQSKLVQIGESVCNIEHQLRSPISRLSSIFMELEAHLTFKGIPKKEHLHNSISTAKDMLINITNSIDIFQDYTDKSKYFYLEDILNKIYNIHKNNFTNNNIILKKEFDNSIKIYASFIEFFHVMLNIITNSIEKLTSENTPNPTITISMIQIITDLKISIKDNGSKIDENKLEKIFDRSFTTKQRNTGLGLYSSKIIIEQNMKGSIGVSNIDDGVKFVIKLPLL